jgi:hypothetical protein
MNRRRELVIAFGVGALVAPLASFTQSGWSPVTARDDAVMVLQLLG